MYFASFADLINMNGHGFYVWLAFSFSVFWLGYLLIKPLLKKNKILQEIRAQISIEESRQEKN